MSDITVGLDSLSLESGLSECEKPFLFLKARYTGLVLCACAHAAFFVKLTHAVRLRVLKGHGSLRSKVSCLHLSADDGILKVGVLGGGHIGKQLTMVLLQFTNLRPGNLKVSSRRPETLGKSIHVSCAGKLDIKHIPPDSTSVKGCAYESTRMYVWKTQEDRASSSHPLTTQNSLGDSAVIHSDHNGVAEVGPEAPLEDEKAQLPPLAPPLTWTFPVTKEFKAKLRLEEAAVLTVYRGDVVTVRVPTVPEGKRLCWEFATDNYDIGFGIYFDWMPVTSRVITVQVSESSDDEDDEGEVEGPVSSRDIESGSKACPISHLGEILPVYRQDSHLAVQAGHHEYPGEGMYLLKFDNSYSLWRNKTLYYRVYYSD
ncbi:UNVERIFIED_CONTAM: hypothetical protein FKN15_060321 [Acipenser sinensis]